MYLYDVGYGSCEESEYIQFSHKKKFDKEEFNSIVEECLYQCLLFEVKREVELAKKYPPMNYFCRGTLSFDGTRISQPSFQDLFMASDGENLVFVREMSKRGFEKAKFEHRLGVFGWSSAVDPNDWKDHTNEDTKLLSQKFAAELEKENIEIHQ